VSNEAAVANTRSLTLGAAAGPLGYLALGLTLLAYGLGSTGIIHNVAASDAKNLSFWVGGVTLFIAGLLEYRSDNAATGTAFAGLGALWITASQVTPMSANASGLFFVLWALLALSLTGAAWRSGGTLVRGTYGLLTVALILWAIAAFAGNSGLDKVGGWVAAVAGLCSWYAATLSLTGGSFGPVSLPSM
jgi:succinate-acetate transporter protein